MSVGATMLPGLEAAARVMPFDQFGRYHMLREALDACRQQLEQETLRVLDVGGFYRDQYGTPSLPIMRFLPNDDVTVLDVVECDLPGYVRGDGADLAFDDASYDFVVTADTLEHIPQHRRAAFWQELLRVAKHGVVLLAPFGTLETETAEALVYAYIKTEMNVEQPQLKEHREYKLPVLSEWLGYLHERDVSAKAYPTGYLHAWVSMMLLKHVLGHIGTGPETQDLVDGFYNRVFFPTERRNPAYRYLIVAEKTAGIVDAVDAALSPTIMPDQPDASQLWGQGMLPLITTILQRQLRGFEHTLQNTSSALNQTLQQTNHIQQHQMEHYLQQISLLERVLADQQVLINRLNEQSGAHNQRVTMLQEQLANAHIEMRLREERDRDAIRDLEERSRWLEQQNQALQQQLAALQNGRVIRALKRLS